MHGGNSHHDKSVVVMSESLPAPIHVGELCLIRPRGRYWGYVQGRHIIPILINVHVGDASCSFMQAVTIIAIILCSYPATHPKTMERVLRAHLRLIKQNEAQAEHSRWVKLSQKLESLLSIAILRVQ